ncbi:glutamine--fructose-6-phosphate transaminase (isomerizing) [Candidatus Thiodictyon syntrophicum]|jgi:glucosamine--fructose-6-phosphate aminotransferase (isomerizing)|uniref:Glutamine--fructose-6-phosphate aminotransferase [isomerizing] n=1 Tax=Candidatus Thiodictyon syntrophicum TaxID=1166950 RepID=A0A2K8UG33_9GAMM|nr:glutamine--fructose-6-phosphate transaminase (isomerizing) [Candidatus Thiodictyon syntrophicum]AUB84553.1 glutamine--fructose-6-phosphate transaminase (isomerizing) [Candidatus Thiodictyon syntrophicum]
MCGIVGAIAQRPVAAILLEGLRRLEYRGYDSAGIAVLESPGKLNRARTLGKVARLAEEVAAHPLPGTLGIAHTRWATHGEPAVRNAHPHICRDRCALVHNGIIENHEELRREQRAAGHRFTSETDTEVVVHAVYDELVGGYPLIEAVRRAAARMTGAYALAVLDFQDPEHLVVARQGSPLVIGVGFGEHFVASDVFALLPVTHRFIFLEEGDIAEITRESVRIWDRKGEPVTRPVKESAVASDSAERGAYRHFMLKEIFEQPRAIADTLDGRLLGNRVVPEAFGNAAPDLFASIQAVTIVACGTSYHAGLVARYWMESLAGLPCNVEVASEYRYRRHVVPQSALFVTISQSGETADTLAALRIAKETGYAATLAICNVPESSLVRESDLVLLTRAGPEIGVASTKAFTTQLMALLLLTVTLGRFHRLDQAQEERLVALMRTVPAKMEQVLALDAPIATLAEQFVDKQHTLFLGRGELYPIAMEGALKLKEISYIHAEAYPAGELKHGPLALIDEDMPVVAVAANNALLEKLKSNLEEVRARGGQLFVFADFQVPLQEAAGITVIRLPETDDLIDPLIFTIPMQLLAYHVAVLKGTDVDQPRNLAKSVTVE